MKNLIALIASLLLLASCGGGNSSSMLFNNSSVNNISDLKLYVGSSTGGKEYIYDAEGKGDSLRLVYINRYFAGVYAPKLYASMTIEFNDQLVTFVDSAYSKKIVSNYTFKHDSLFVIQSSGAALFIAQGTTDLLYRTKGLARYPNPRIAGDTIRTINDNQSLEKLLTYAGYTGGLADMTNPKDTLVWCNVKYVFK